MPPRPARRARVARHVGAQHAHRRLLEAQHARKAPAAAGTDYTPHNLHAYPDHSHWRKGIRPQPPGSPPVQGGLCDLPPSSGGGDDGGLEWTVMRVGPFTSHGGYDWWQYAGHDALKLSRHLTGGRTVAVRRPRLVGLGLGYRV